MRELALGLRSFALYALFGDDVCVGLHPAAGVIATPLPDLPLSLAVPQATTRF